jgi:hypothetical protein
MYDWGALVQQRSTALMNMLYYEERLRRRRRWRFWLDVTGGVFTSSTLVSATVAVLGQPWGPGVTAVAAALAAVVAIVRPAFGLDRDIEAMQILHVRYTELEQLYGALAAEVLEGRTDRRAIERASERMRVVHEFEAQIQPDRDDKALVVCQQRAFRIVGIELPTTPGALSVQAPALP